MDKAFTTKERKKEFDIIFKEKIVPLFNLHGFERHTKTSKRLFKNLGDNLTVFVFFEYKNLFQFYDTTIAYFDEEIGTIYDDNYLAIANEPNLSFSGNHKKEFHISVNKWLTDVKLKIFPFIEKHSTHKSILESDCFYISKGRLNEITELLKRKSIIK